MTRNTQIVILALTACLMFAGGFIAGERLSPRGVRIENVYSYRVPGVSGPGKIIGMELAKQ